MTNLRYFVKTQLSFMAMYLLQKNCLLSPENSQMTRLKAACFRENENKQERFLGLPHPFCLVVTGGALPHSF